MTNGQAGKGDTYRPVNFKAWEKNYQRIFQKGRRRRPPARPRQRSAI